MEVVFEMYSQPALHFRLEALSCPLDPLPPLDDALALQTLVAWLEDSHIRRHPPSERGSLVRRDFLPALRTYLAALTAPPHVVPPAAASRGDPDAIAPAAQWLVDVALALFYADDAHIYNEPVDPWHGLCVPYVSGAAQDPEVKEASLELLRALGVKEEPASAEDAVHVVADLVETAVARPALPDIDEQEALRMLDEIPLGFATGDADVDRTAKVIRLLHMKELRTLQDDINDVVMDMQKVTANPKTNSKLGRVGR